MDDYRYDQAVSFLLGRINYERATRVIPYREREYKLDRMRELLRRLGEPQKHLKIVHIAGTKGKGSTATMLGAMATAAGYRVGMFTSPHLERLEERIAIDGHPCRQDELAELVDRVRSIVDVMDVDSDGSAELRGPTYFELTTALALLHFASSNVDLALLEVGMGGRLDSTNVCQPICSVITSISFDHTRQLGGTLAKIASEKAGIVKPGVPVVSGVRDGEARDVIARIAEQRGSRIIQRDEDFCFEYRPPRDLDHGDGLGELDFRSEGELPARKYDRLPLRMPGRHQAANAAVALAVIVELSQQGWNFEPAALASGLANAQCPARVETVRRRPVVVVDAAHNVASIEALVQVLDESFAAPHRVLVFATSRDKDLDGMLRRLLPRFDHTVFTRYLNNPRSVGPADLAAATRRLCDADNIAAGPWDISEGPAEAWQIAQQHATPDSLVCVTGSFFIAAEMRQLLAAEDAHPTLSKKD